MGRRKFELDECQTERAKENQGLNAERAVLFLLSTRSD